MFNVESEAELDAISRVASPNGTQGPGCFAAQSRHRRQNARQDDDRQARQQVRHGHRKGRRCWPTGSGRQPSAAVRHSHAPGLADPDDRALRARPSRRRRQVVADFRRRGHEIDWINLGGGFGISYRKQEGPPAAEYAKVIVPAVREAGCRLALEPGRFIVGNAGVPRQPGDLHQAGRGQEVRHSGRGDERSGPPRNVRRVSPHLAGPAPRRSAGRLRGGRRRLRAGRRRRPDLRVGRLPGQGPLLCPRSNGGTFWSRSAPGPTEWR